MIDNNNPLGLHGIEFTEFATPEPQFMNSVFLDFGFSKLKQFKNKAIIYYQQNGINFLLNKEKSGFANQFAQKHGPSICSMGWRVEDAEYALQTAVARGAIAATNESKKDLPYPAIYGIGDSLIYFIDHWGAQGSIYNDDFIHLDSPVITQEKGFLAIDHLTNNVIKGTMQHWADFYKNVFAFTEVRYFDIQGKKTALQSYALQSPCKSFSIPINEGKDDNNNQIDEYLQQYHGPGVQHLAFLTKDLVSSLEKINKETIPTLNIIPEYYDNIFQRVPWVKENKDKIKQLQVLVDSQKEYSYLLQIFTKNLFGPIFIEMIQRVDDSGFGEGNFQALFDSIELDQMARGVI